jgi:hypothetical protein
LSLASGDFYQDGIASLVVGYGTSGGGILTLSPIGKDDCVHASAARASADSGDSGRDFLRAQTRVTRLQFVGLLVLGLNLMLAGIVIWVIYVSPSLALKDTQDIAILISGSAFCVFLGYLAYLHIRRAFAGRRRN